MLSLTVALVILVICLLWGYNMKRQSYWSSRGVDGPTPTPFLGNFLNLISGKPWQWINKVYRVHKQQKVFGTYECFTPSVFICDPELIRLVLVKNFDHFENRRSFKLPGKYKWMNEMLTAVNGKEWKTLRSTLSPTFSSGKMKSMFPTICRQGNNLVKYCSKFCEPEATLDTKDAFGRFTMDVIAATAFGIESNSLVHEDAIFSKMGDAVFKKTWTKLLRTMLFLLLPMKVIQFFRIKIADESWDFFSKVSCESLAERRKSGVKRGDFLDLLLDEQERQKENFDENKDYKITDQTILAESVLFLLAGYDTTANTLCITNYYLAKHQDVQEKLLLELKNIFDDDGEIDYFKLTEAKYLDACISEALRLNPPASATERKCTKDFLIPGTRITITEGMMAVMPVCALHRDPEYWPDSEEFKPERFLPENKPNHVPFTYMPFGLGPRNCIAMRFALMEAKVGVAKLILNYKITLAQGYEKLELETGHGLLRPGKSGVTMNIERRI